MVIKPEQERVRTLIADTVSLLCKNGLNYTKSFCIEGLLGITLDNDEIFLVNIKEVIKTDLGNEEEAASSDASDGSKSTTSKKKRKRKRKKRDQDSGDDSNEEDNSNFAQENSSSIGEPPNKNVKQEQLDDDDEDLVFVKDEPGASNFNFGQMSQFGASTSQNSSILGDMSQQGQLYGTPSTDPMPTSSQWMPDPSQLQNTPGQSQMFSPSSQQQQQPGGPNPQQDGDPSLTAVYTPTSRKHRGYTTNYKVDVIDWHHSNKSTVSRTAKEFGIDRKQVRNWLENETYLRLNTIGDSAEKKRLGAGSKPQCEELDLKVLKIYLTEKEAGRTMKNKDIKATARSVSAALPGTERTFMASDGWLLRWKKRYSAELGLAETSPSMVLAAGRWEPGAGAHRGSAKRFKEAAAAAQASKNLSALFPWNSKDSQNPAAAGLWSLAAAASGSAHETPSGGAVFPSSAVKDDESRSSLTEEISDKLRRDDSATGSGQPVWPGMAGFERFEPLVQTSTAGTPSSTHEEVNVTQIAREVAQKIERELKDGEETSVEDRGVGESVYAGGEKTEVKSENGEQS